MRISIVCAIFLLFFVDCTHRENDFKKYAVRAFSLKNVEKNLGNPTTLSIIQSFGGINRFIGFVLDREAEDIILVGIENENTPKANFDDFVVALRSRLLYNEFPLVSIDPVQDSYTTRLQNVRFDGHLENTEFGQKFLNCDVILKKYSLQKLEPIPEVHPYTKLLETDIVYGCEKDGNKVKNIQWIIDQDFSKEINKYSGSSQKRNFEFQARFWFYPLEPLTYISRPDVFLIRDLNIGLQAEQVFSTSENKIEARDKFVESWTSNFDKLYKKIPELMNLKILYDLTAIANALSDSSKIVKQFKCLDYLLNHYNIKYVNTPGTYKLEEILGKVEMDNGLIDLLSISGGIKFGEEVKLLNQGNYGKLKDIVFNARPDSKSLVWGLPVKGWIAPNTKDISPLDTRIDGEENQGSSIYLQTVTINPAKNLPRTDRNAFNGFTAVQHEPKPLKGVSMKMVIDNRSFKPAGEKLNKIKEQILKKR